MEKNKLLHVQKLRQIPAVPESQEYWHNVAGPLAEEQNPSCSRKYQNRKKDIKYCTYLRH